jgi:hypothetical protein
MALSHNRVLPAVVGTDDRFEGLLPGRVPDHRFDGFAVEIERLAAELDAQGCLVVAVVAALGELQEQAGLSDAYG